MFTKEEKSLIQKLVQKKRALSGLFFFAASEFQTKKKQLLGI
jgi:hypothetical protein